jgi:HSP20 family protein
MNPLESSTDLSRPVRAALDSGQARQEAVVRVAPRVDVYENEEELLLVADVPGARHESIEVRLDPPRLTIEAQQTRASYETEGTVLRRFERAFRVPDGLDPERIDATLDHGVLRIHLKKSERIKPKKIAVRGE